MEINKANLKTIRDEINAALAAIGEKHGMNLSTGNINYHAEGFRTQLTALNVSTDSSAEAVPTNMLKYVDNAQRWLVREGYSTDLLNKEFVYNGKKYVFIGAKANRRDTSMAVKAVDSGQYVFIKTADMYAMVAHIS